MKVARPGCGRWANRKVWAAVRRGVGSGKVGSSGLAPGEAVSARLSCRSFQLWQPPSPTSVGRRELCPALPRAAGVTVASRAGWGGRPGRFVLWKEGKLQARLARLAGAAEVPARSAALLSLPRPHASPAPPAQTASVFQSKTCSCQGSATVVPLRDKKRESA